MLIYQTIHGPDGNCYEACLASVLGTSIPDIFTGQTWAIQVKDWLINRGWDCEFLLGSNKPLIESARPMGYAICSHRVLNGHVHAALFLDGELIHDPSGRPFCRDDCIVLLWTVLNRPAEKLND